MTTDGPRAHDILLSYEPLSRHGACWFFTWQAYAAAGASTSMGSTATAYQGWQATQGKHYDMNPPHGAAIWLGKRYDGNMDGDVFIAGAADGQHAATDEPIYGQTGVTSIRDRMHLTGREYLGWTDHVLDVPITMGTDPEEDDVKITNTGVTFREGQTYGPGRDPSEGGWLRKEDDGNTRVFTGPSLTVTGTLSIAFMGLLPGQVAEVRPVKSTPRDDGSWDDASLWGVEFHGVDDNPAAATYFKVPVNTSLNEGQILRFKVYGQNAEVEVYRAQFRGAEFTKT